MIRIVAAAIAIVFSLTPAMAAEVTLKSGTPVIVTPGQTVSSDSVNPGDTINGSVVSDVKVDGQVVIKSGAGATISVSRVEKSGSIGEGGALQLEVNSVYAVDGQRIPVSGSQTVRGEEKTTESVAVGAIICPLALLMEGEEAQMSSNAEIRTITQTETDIALGE